MSVKSLSYGLVVCNEKEDKIIDKKNIWIKVVYNKDIRLTKF